MFLVYEGIVKVHRASINVSLVHCRLHSSIRVNRATSRGFCLILIMEAALCSVTEVQGKQGLVNVTHLLKDTSVVGKYVSMSVRVWTVCTVILSYVSDLAF